MNEHLAAFGRQLEDSTFDVFFITQKENVYWLTGFWGSFGMVAWCRGKGFTLLTDARYEAPARDCAQREGIKFLLYTPELLDQYKDILEGNIGVEPTLELSRLRHWEKCFPRAKFTMGKDTIAPLRRIKTAAEIEAIRTAQSHVDRVLVPCMKNRAKAGVSERSLAFYLEQTLREEGKYGMAFDAIVAFGEHSAVPHHEPGERALRPGDPVLVDCGVTHNHWCSDMTRNFTFGEASPQYRAHYDALLAVQQHALTHYRAGKDIAAADLDTRAQLGDLAEYFSHSLGHGVGLEIHESPAISKRAEGAFVEHEVVTCEPGIYFPEQYGIRIEDLIVIRMGDPEILSTTTKELIMLEA